MRWEACRDAGSTPKCFWVKWGKRGLTLFLGGYQPFYSTYETCFLAGSELLGATESAATVLLQNLEGDGKFWLCVTQQIYPIM